MTVSFIASTINHTITQKKRDAPLRIARGGVGWSLCLVCRMHHAVRVHRYIQREQKDPHSPPVTYYFCACYTY